MKWAVCMLSRRLARLVGRSDITAGTLRRIAFIGFYNSYR